MKINMRGNNTLLDCFDYALELDTSCKKSRPLVLERALECVISYSDTDFVMVQKFGKVKKFSRTTVPENISLEIDSQLFDKAKNIIATYFPNTNLQYPFICRIALTSYIIKLLDYNESKRSTNSVLASNKNENLMFAYKKNIIIDSRIIELYDLRGIYGIFVENECVYVGRANSMYSRMFKGDCHIRSLRLGVQVSKLQNGFNSGKRIEIKVLEIVEYNENNHPAKEAQRLASRECWWIDHFQEEDQCLEQYPEGRWN